MAEHIVLMGRRVSLATITRDDIRIIWEYFGDFNLRLYLFNPWQPIYFEDEIKFYEEMINNKENNIFFKIIENKSKSRLVGLISLNDIDLYSRHAGLGYWIWKDHWNKGYATEAVNLMLKYAFEWLNLNKVYAIIYEPNKASQKVLEKNGFKFVGRLRKQRYIPTIGYVDELYYDLLRDEWRNIDVIL
jgi:RimJ/RimL family protein N-acetyltransferase